MTEQLTSHEYEDWTSLEETITPDPVDLPPTPTASATVEPEGSPSQELLLDPDTQETPDQDDSDFSCVRKQCRDRPQSNTYTIPYTERGGRKRALKICGYCSTGWHLDENLNPLGKGYEDIEGEILPNGYFKREPCPCLQHNTCINHAKTIVHIMVASVYMFPFKFKTTPLFHRRNDIVNSMIFIMMFVVSEIIAFMVLRVYRMRSENMVWKCMLLQVEPDWCYGIKREFCTIA